MVHEILESLVSFVIHVGEVAMQSSLDKFFRASLSDEVNQVIVIDEDKEVDEEEDLEEHDENGSGENENMVCSSECCELYCPGPNQPTSTSVLNATK